ncbi:hypothetical protein HYV89_02655 [Candidatus Woesearchaeota archaeon]|nr:hypothetical protein [Candidatus Woesearchaeota archaeon]
MPSQKSKFLSKAMQLMGEKGSALKALEEFEKTGRTITKTRLNFTIDREIAREFRDYCRKHRLNMSKQIEDLIKKKIKAN